LLGARNHGRGQAPQASRQWRTRWLDEHGQRQSAVFDDYKRAQTELSRKQVEVEEVRRGIRNAAPPEKTVNDLCDYWIEKRAPRKRGKKDDESIAIVRAYRERVVGRFIKMETDLRSVLPFRGDACAAM
jgi:hypothetical protein